MGRLGVSEAQPPGLETSEGWAWGSGEGGGTLKGPRGPLPQTILSKDT